MTWYDRCDAAVCLDAWSGHPLQRDDVSVDIYAVIIDNVLNGLEVDSSNSPSLSVALGVADQGHGHRASALALSTSGGMQQGLARSVACVSGTCSSRLRAAARDVVLPSLSGEARH